MDLDYAIRVDKPNISEIVKAISPSIIEESTTLVEKLINYVRLTYLFTGKSIYIFNQIKNLLKDDDLKQLYKYFEYEKLVFISFEAQTREKLLNEKYTIIDSDLCIIK